MAAASEPKPADDHQAVAVDTSLSGKPEYPGQTMGIVALVLAFFSQLPALILGIIAWVWSNRAGVSNVPAKVAVAVSATLIIVGVLIVIGWVVFIASSIGNFGNMGGFGGAFLT